MEEGLPLDKLKTQQTLFKMNLNGPWKFAYFIKSLASQMHAASAESDVEAPKLFVLSGNLAKQSSP